LPLRVGYIIDHTLRAAPSKGFDQLRANPARAARDQRDFSGEIKWIRHLTILRFNDLTIQR
jgi:hypothetical protein